jgi:WD40 repeat protein
MTRAAKGVCWCGMLAGMVAIMPLDAPRAQTSAPPAGATADAAGDALPARALARFGTARWRHGSRIQCMAIASDGRIAAGGGNDPVRIWDSGTGKELRQLPEPFVSAMAFSRRGGELVTGGALKIVRIWDLKEGKEGAQLAGHNAPITAVAVSSDNSLVASGSEDGVIILWEKGIKNITQVAQVKGHTDRVTALAFSTDLDSVYLASGSADRTVRVWHTDQKKVLWQKDAGCAVAAVAFVGEKTVASAGDEKLIRLWNAADGQALPPLPGHPGGVAALAASRDGNIHTLVSSGDDGNLRVWNIDQRTEMLSIPNLAGDGDALALSKDGLFAACGGANHTIRVFDAKNGKERTPGPGLQAGLVHLALAPDGKSLASVTSNGKITIWNRQTAQPIRSWESGHQGEIVLAYSPNGALLASGSKNDPLRLWDPQTGKESFQFPAKQGDEILTLAFSTEGTLLAAGYRSGAADVWDWQQKKTVLQPKLATPAGVYSVGVKAVAFSPDGALLGLGGAAKVALWDIAAAKEIRVLDSKEGVPANSMPTVSALAFAADGKTLAVGCYDGMIRLVDRVKGKEIRTLEGHGSVPYSLAFSRDGRILVSGSFDKTVRVWEAFSGLTVAPLAGHQGPVYGVAITRDGRNIFSASSDTSILHWDVTGRTAEGFDPAKAPLVDLESAWRNLASEDTSLGHRALWDLVVHNASGVPYLGKQLYLIDPMHIDQLLKDLGDKSFNIRKNASAELERYGRWMEGRFKAALVNPPDLEVQRRIEQMLSKLTGGLTLEQERIRVRRVMLVLEQVNSPAARQVLESLVKGAPEVELQSEARVSLERLGKIN